MKHIWMIALLAGCTLACTPNPKEGERNSGTVEAGNQDGSQTAQPQTDSTADNTEGNGSTQTPSDNTITNEGSETSGAAGQ